MLFPHREVGGMQFHDDGLFGVQSLDHFAHEVLDWELIREHSAKHQLRGDSVCQFDRGLLQFGQDDLLPMNLHRLGGDLQLMGRLIERFEVFALLSFQLSLSGRIRRLIPTGFRQREVNQPAVMSLQPFGSRSGRVAEHNATNRQFQSDCRFGHRSSIPASVREIRFAHSAILMKDRLASRFFGADCRESSMKVASTLTNATSDTTGLPSLLNVDAASFPTADSSPVVPLEKALSERSVTDFDAILAAFGVAPNLPQPTPELSIVTAKDSDTLATPVAFVELVHQATLVLSSPSTADVGILPTDNPATAAFVPAISDFPAQLAHASTQELKPQADPLVSAEPLLTEQRTASQAPVIPLAGEVLIPSTNDGVSLAAIEQRPASHDFPARSVIAEHTDVVSSPPQSEFSDRELSRTADAHPTTKELAAFDRLPAAEDEEKTAILPLFDEISRAAAEPKIERYRREVEIERVQSESLFPQAHLMTQIDHAEPRINTSALTESVTAVVQARGADSSDNGPIDVQLRLDPPELGMVRVHLRLTDETVSIRFIAGDEAITRMLETQLPDLRRSLSERGLQFAHCDVSCDGRQQHSSDFRRDRDSQPFNFEASSRFAQAPTAATSTATRAGLTRSNRLNVLA